MRMKRSFWEKPFPYVYYNTALILIVANFCLFLLVQLFPQSRFLALLALSRTGIVRYKAFWEFLTYMFIHVNFSHILMNMIALFFFGPQVEKEMGSWEFLLFYLLTGTLSGIFSYFVYLASGYGGVVIGASGAVFSVLFAFAVFYPQARIFIMGIIPIRSVYLVLLYTAIELGSQILSLSTGIAHLTHLAGFVFAFLYILLRLRINPIDSFRRVR